MRKTPQKKWGKGDGGAITAPSGQDTIPYDSKPLHFSIFGYTLKLSIGFFLSFDNIDNKVKNLVKIDLSDKIR